MIRNDDDRDRTDAQGRILRDALDAYQRLDRSRDWPHRVSDDRDVGAIIRFLHNLSMEIVAYDNWPAEINRAAQGIVAALPGTRVTHRIQGIGDYKVAFAYRQWVAGVSFCGSTFSTKVWHQRLRHERSFVSSSCDAVVHDVVGCFRCFPLEEA